MPEMPDAKARYLIMVKIALGELGSIWKWQEE
jgi:hypothetical protein